MGTHVPSPHVHTPTQTSTYTERERENRAYIQHIYAKSDLKCIQFRKLRLQWEYQQYSAVSQK